MGDVTCMHGGWGMGDGTRVRTVVELFLRVGSSQPWPITNASGAVPWSPCRVPRMRRGFSTHWPPPPAPPPPCHTARGTYPTAGGVTDSRPTFAELCQKIDKRCQPIAGCSETHLAAAAAARGSLDSMSSAGHIHVHSTATPAPVGPVGAHGGLVPRTSPDMTVGGSPIIDHRLLAHRSTGASKIIAPASGEGTPLYEAALKSGRPGPAVYTPLFCAPRRVPSTVGLHTQLSALPARVADSRIDSPTATPLRVGAAFRGRSLYGHADIILAPFLAFCRPTSPRLHGTCFAWCSCLPDAECCLQSDAQSSVCECGSAVTVTVTVL